jgi:predicted Zn-dependent protease
MTLVGRCWSIPVVSNVRRGAFLRIPFIGALLALAAACAQPTGGAIGTRPAPVAEQAHATILRSWGGAYGDQRIQAYVETIGRKLAAATGGTAARWRFTVLDHPLPLGLTTGDGDIYVTRGVLALLDNEAELAALLAHEMAHVVLGHRARSVEQQRRELSAVRTAMEQNEMREAARLLIEGVLRLRAYSREAENEADRYAVGLLAKAGYATDGVAGLLARLRDYGDHLERRSGRVAEAVEIQNMLASHPAMNERLAAVRREAESVGAKGGVQSGPAYLEAIDGIVVGRDNRIGVVRDGRLLHGVYGVRVSLPAGYAGLPDRRLPGAMGRDGGGFVFRCEPETVSGDMEAWLRQRTRQDGTVQVRPFAVTGFDAASVAVPLRYRSGMGEAQFIAIRKESDVCRFLVFVPPTVGAQGSAALQDSVRSFASLSAAEQAAVRPYRLRIQHATGGETLDGLARRQRLSPQGAELLRVLNGVEERQTLTPGRTVKLVVQD